MQKFKILGVAAAVLLSVGCATSPVSEKADPIEGLWTLRNVECPGSSLTSDGKKWVTRVQEHKETYVMRYTHGGKAHLFGKSAGDSVDQMNYCDLDADFEWADRQLPSVCDYHAASTRRGHVAEEVCNDQYRYAALLCVWAGSNIQGGKLRFSLGDTQQAKSKMIDIKTFLPQLCEDGQPVLVFDRVM